MAIRRVVTGRRAGKSVLFQDGQVPTEHHYATVSGMMSAIIWTTEPTPRVDREEAAPVGTPGHPAPGHSVLSVVDFPPESETARPDFDPVAAAAEQAQHMPGMVERFEPDNPGMHTTDTVDYVIVLHGKIWLEVDDGESTLLEAGDMVVQQRTRHAWRNRGSEPARLAFVMIGTDVPASV